TGRASFGKQLVVHSVAHPHQERELSTFEEPDRLAHSPFRVCAEPGEERAVEEWDRQSGRSQRQTVHHRHLGTARPSERGPRRSELLVAEPGERVKIHGGNIEPGWNVGEWLGQVWRSKSVSAMKSSSLSQESGGAFGRTTNFVTPLSMYRRTMSRN